MLREGSFTAVQYEDGTIEVFDIDESSLPAPVELLPTLPYEIIQEESV